jgi:hypothetical protein
VSWLELEALEETPALFLFGDENLLIRRVSSGKGQRDHASFDPTGG